MRVRTNLATGLVSSAWSAILSFAIIPFYLRFLGVEAYGLIGFFATLQVVFQVLDLGIGPAVNREVARALSTNTIGEAKKLVHTLAIIYWIVGGVIALGIAAFSPLISTYWIHSQKLPAITVQEAIILMGIVLAGRWPAGLYTAGVNGAHRLALSSLVTMFTTTLGTIGAVLVLAFVSRTIQAFFIWQATVALLNALLMRQVAWGVLGKEAGIRFDLEKLKQIWRFSSGMLAIMILGIIFTQMDKVLLSHFLSLADFGGYMLASAVAGTLGLVIAPIFNVLYPRLAGLIVTGKTPEVLLYYRLATRGISAALFSISIILGVVAVELITLWTRNPQIAVKIGPIIALLALGSAFNGTNTVAHALMLADGNTKLPIIINSVLLVFMAPTIITLVYLYGGIGGALAWLILNSLYTAFSLTLLHRNILTQTSIVVSIADISTSIFFAAIAGVSTEALKLAVPLPPAVLIISGGTLGVVAMAASVMVWEPSRRLVLQLIDQSRARLIQSGG